MKGFYYFLILILIITFIKVDYAFGQDLIEDDSADYNRLSDSIAKYKEMDNLRLSIDFAKDRLEIAERYRDTIKIIQTLHYVGRVSQFISEVDQSIEYFEKELELLQTIDLNQEKYKNLADNHYSEIEVLAQLGQNYAVSGQIEKAFSFYDRCLEIAHDKNLGFYKAVMPNIIADLHFVTGNYAEALNMQKESYHALKITNDIDEATRVLNVGSAVLSMSETYIALKELDSALWILDKGERQKLDTFDLKTKGRFLGQRGYIYAERKEYNKAIDYYTKAEKLFIEYDSVIGPASYSLQLGECYMNLEKYDLALSKLEEGLQIKEQKTEEINFVEDYKLLAQAYKEIGNTEKSNEYYEKYIINQTALEKSKDTISNTFHNKEIQDLNEEKIVQKKKLQFIIGSVLLLVLILSFVIGYLIHEKRKNAKKFKTLLSRINSEKEQEPDIVDTKDLDLEEKSSAEVNEETTEQILVGLQKLKEQKYFLKQECNAYNVAKKIKTNTTYLSKVINSHFQKNFNTYINDLRINYAILRLKNDSRFRSFSVQSIAEELGYKSADSFAKYFKLRTGLNPSFYIKELQNLS